MPDRNGASNLTEPYRFNENIVLNDETLGDAGPVPSAGTAAPRAHWRRGPRAEELALMRTLLSGPCPITSGPIGRCVKRGWCRPLIIDPPNEIGTGGYVLYGLTEAGRSLLAG